MLLEAGCLRKSEKAIFTLLGYAEVFLISIFHFTVHDTDIYNFGCSLKNVFKETIVSFVSGQISHFFFHHCNNIQC